MRFPTLSNDPLEQFLLEEAVLEPYVTAKAVEEQERRKWGDAYRRGKELLGQRGKG